MRTAEFNDGTITYPDEIAFAFNPVIIQLENTNKGDVTVDITDTSTAKKYSDTRSFFENILSIDISKYLQLLFSRPEYGGTGENVITTSKNIQIDVKENSRIFTFEFVCIWGNIEAGETFNNSRAVKWFKYFPQTVSMYIPEGTDLQYRSNQSGYANYDGANANEINHILLAKIFSTTTTKGALRIIGGETSSVWSYTFDYTFAKNPDYETIINIDIDDCSEGVFLRWVDRFGFYQYWLFKPVEWGYDSSSDGESIIDRALVNTRHYEYSRYQGRTNERTIRLGASLLTQDEANLVIGIIQSPLVSVWDGQWSPVTISDGEVKLTSEHLQDIEITINLQEIKTQRL